MSPYLSIVVTSRNDNHGGDTMRRMCIFIKGLIAQTNRYQLPCELVFIDWNPPADQPLLKDVLPKPQADDFLKVRYVIVPNGLHQQLRYSEKMNLYQMIAKNVGIRRSTADFVLCTNIDLLFSNELFEFLAKRSLQKGCFYRANRCDVPSEVNEDAEVQDQLKYCSEHILKRLGVDKDHPYDFVKEHYTITFKYKFLKPLQKFRYLGTEEVAKIPYHRIKSLDLDACGDFTLMHRKDWELIQGYQELEMYSLHIDSLALFAADAMGIQQVVLSKECCTYHMQHGDGWDHMEVLQKLKFYQKWPTLDWLAVSEIGEKMIEQNKVFTVNNPNWGYKDMQLDEYTVPV